MATAVAARFHCRLQVVDCHKEYWSQVTRYTMEKVKAGFTPNPDVMCNRLIKFGAFDEKMGHDYDLIATGHYAQTEWIDGRKWLTTSPDPVKDQTDFLAQIYNWQLQKLFSPSGTSLRTRCARSLSGSISSMRSAKIRRGSASSVISTTTNMSAVISASSPATSSNGRRESASASTADCGSTPSDSAKDSDSVADRGSSSRKTWENILYVSHGYDPQTAYKQDFTIHDFHFLTTEVDQPRVTFKIRHTPEYLTGSVEHAGEGRYIIHADKKIHGVAPGQFCVVYDEQHHRCFGSGEIEME